MFTVEVCGSDNVFRPLPCTFETRTAATVYAETRNDLRGNRVVEAVRQYPALTVGVKVELRGTFKGSTWVKYGEIVENPGLGRVRVRWSHWVYPSGQTRADGKRTWYKASKLVVSK